MKAAEQEEETPATTADDMVELDIRTSGRGTEIKGKQ